MLRVVLLHPSGENFSTLEACALERVELADDAAPGEQRELEAAQARAEYLHAMMPLLPRFAAPPKILLGVTGKASEAAAKEFFEALRVPAHFTGLPLAAGLDFKQKVKCFQQGLARRYEEGYDFVFWMGSVGERLRLILPAPEQANFNASDAVLAHLLRKRWIKSWRVVNGWLMPEAGWHGTPAPASEPAPVLTGMNSSMAKLAQKCGFAKWYGFDGNGGITVSTWMNYHDALMALAHVLPLMAGKKAHQLARAAEDLATHHHLLPCPDEAKAQVMRRLIESFDDHLCEVNDGVKIKSKAGWVVVRLCAGRSALEVFKCARQKEAAGGNEVEALYARVLRNLNEWIVEIQDEMRGRRV